MKQVILAAAALAITAPAFAEPLTTAAAPIPTVATEHQVMVDGGPLHYRAVFAQKVLTDKAGKPQATISATAYLREGPAATARPVTFVFNGGPGASSSPLQFGVMGPRLRNTDGSGMVDNPDTPLDRTDLVFIDPVGTGFSRVLPGGSGKPYWDVAGDARSVLGLIRSWLADNHRTGASVYIVGESYGGTRLATMLHDAQDLNLAGLVFISPSFEVSAPDPDIEAIVTLPSLAVAAVQNGKVDAHGRSVDQVFEDARAFAFGDYATALLEGSAIDPATETRVAERMSGLIGLPSDELRARHLRIDVETFRTELLKDRGLVVGRLDSRVTAPIPKASPAGRPSAANDPALGLGRSNVILSKAITTYMRNELQVPTREDYVSLTLDVNFQWSWPPTIGADAFPSLTGDIAAAMKDKPHLRLLLIGGYYDMAVPVMAPRYALERAWLPTDRVRMVALPAGHSALESPSGRKEMKLLFDGLIQ